MAALYGRLKGNRGEATRMGHQEITATLETWEGEVRTVLFKSGDFFVYVGEKGGSLSTEPVFRGNVNAGSLDANWSCLKRRVR